MTQYIYTMNKVSKIIPLKREVLKDISLLFFPRPKSWHCAGFGVFYCGFFAKYRATKLQLGTTVLPLSRA